MTSSLDKLPEYSVYGVCIAEVELDVLTGNHLVTRVDLIEDTGRSISPEIDVGQVRPCLEVHVDDLDYDIEEVPTKCLKITQ